MLAAAIVGTGIHAYRTYVIQRAANNPWWLPLWPQHFDTTGTKALIGAGAGIVLTNVIYIAISFLSKFDQAPRSLLASLAGIVLSTASSLIAIFSIVLILILNRRAPESDTIQTWTCKFSLNIPNAMIMPDGVQSADLSNDLFGTLCRESKFGFYGMVSVLVLQFLLFISVIAKWFTGRQPQQVQDYDGYGASRPKNASDGYSF
ncbi:hypothetical protein EJ08DRAFT_696401 [Tothia fuscella]|uniref:Uncharacterized protein n=1 Tax=Tothia fuscella TaxID=1048955 RepID=A0A9P4NUP6_9PEZI|nr:hypothetical protein EJ08DRAFT_696401 [Tothia fuscella]